VRFHPHSERFDRTQEQPTIKINTKRLTFPQEMSIMKGDKYLLGQKNSTTPTFSALCFISQENLGH
jgi:hypothetical protein